MSTENRLTNAGKIEKYAIFIARWDAVKCYFPSHIAFLSAAANSQLKSSYLPNSHPKSNQYPFL